MGWEKGWERMGWWSKVKFLGGIIMNQKQQAHDNRVPEVTEGPQITALEPQGLTPILVQGTPETSIR